MKKILVIIVLSIFLIANSAFGADLVGTWEYTQDCVLAADPNVPGDPWDETPAYTTETVEFVIQEQDAQGRLFGCAVTGSNPPDTYFYGVLDGRDLYITSWDSMTFGTVSKNGRRIDFVNRRHGKNFPTAPGACIGRAIKMLDSFDLCPSP